MLITPEQIRAARALLRLEQQELAERAGLSTATLRRLEAPGGTERVAAETVATVRHVLEQAGAEFVADGVRRRKLTDAERQARLGRILELSRRSAEMAAGYPSFSDADLYDERGAPA